jgi:serine/threonine-protein kinase
MTEDPLAATAPPVDPAKPIATCRMCDHDHAPGSPQCPLSRVGTTVAAKYRLERLLGAGGMGAVYEAENVGLGKRIAVKMLHARLAAMPAIVGRFRREARAIANLHHRGFPQVHALESAADGSLVIEMELLHGTPLDKLAAGGKLAIARATAVLASALEALAVAHEAGLVHRDLKPENLMACDDDVVKILDFGIARAEDDQQLTATGQVFGTIAYAAPEQLRSSGDADARSDVYSMGATAFELLTGRTPAGQGNVTEVISKILTGDIERSPAKLRADVPVWLDAWVVKALADKRDERFASAREMLAALRAGDAATVATVPPVAAARPAATVLETVPPVPAAKKAPPTELVHPPRSRTPYLAIAIGALAIGGAAIAYVATRSSSTPPSSSDAGVVDRGSAQPRKVETTQLTPPPPPAIDAALPVAVASGPPIVVDLTVWRSGAALAPGAVVHAGDKLAFQIATSREAYVYLVQRIGDQLDVLLPDAHGAIAEPIGGGRKVRIPETGAFTLVDDGTYGTVAITVIASATQLADLESALASTNAQAGDVQRTAVRTAATAIDKLADPHAPGGTRARGHLEQLGAEERRTISVRYRQRPEDPLVVAEFRFEQRK